jgi:hypothetical protein
VLVTKNPCLHPGDLRVLRAVDNPRLSHLVNVVVFPRKVKRPISDMITGSDLDGDIYWACWDKQVRGGGLAGVCGFIIIIIIIIIFFFFTLHHHLYTSSSSSHFIIIYTLPAQAGLWAA